MLLQWLCWRLKGNFYSDGDSLAKKKIDYLPHDLVPKHEVIPEKETEKLIKDLGLDSKSGLPKIKKDDAGLKIHGLKLKEGDVVKIYRKDDTGKNIYYRMVIS